MEASTPFSSIPNEIIRHILLQLPMKAVIRCQCVCKQWRSLIDDLDFKLSYSGKRRVIILSLDSKSQDYSWNSRFLVRSTSHDSRLQRHKLPFGEVAYPLICASDEYRVRSLCSCNGFVLLLAERDILLWNPFTRYLTKVLKVPYPKELNSVILGGLCYDSSTRDYKAVLSIRPLIEPGLQFGYPFVISASLSHKEWRRVQFPYNLDSAKGGVEFRNNTFHCTFHWWASDIKDWEWKMDYFSGGNRNRIVYFDPVCDEFIILPTPELRQNFPIVGLGVINDCLSMACMIHKQKNSNPIMMQVLIMKEYGIQESWMTAFAIQINSQYPYTIASYGLTFYSQKNNAQEVLFLHPMNWFLGKVYVYDRKKDEMREVRLDFPNNDICCVSMCFYVESLASLPLQPHMIN
ncbi:F-box/kelch-repeat protein At3g23880-like [Ipomoea triloba]|uniref:F-box/kelch-repeat protein At3g23880-like n=1 Tax=Ipomoea triloba TaxID=35885 RepID=UPI00125D5461|nr:F-box/kelch-repeat protein At3g23880-like [Ipomoea triloba]